jgi:integrase
MSASNSAATRPRPVSGDAEREVAALLWRQVGQAFQWAARLDRVVDRDGASRVRPRDARLSFATLLIYEGQPPPYVAEQLGHSPATILRDYARVWGDFDPSQRINAEEQIARVRGRIEHAGPADEHHRPTPELFRDAPRTGRAFPISAAPPRRKSRKART